MNKILDCIHIWSSFRFIGPFSHFRRFSPFFFFFRSSARSLALLRWPVPTFIFCGAAPGWNMPRFAEVHHHLHRCHMLMLAICRIKPRT